MTVENTKQAKPVLHGRDIQENITAHQLAGILLAGPDLVIRVPDSDSPDCEWNTETLGRITHDDKRVYLCAYFLSNAEDVSEHFDIAADYEHYHFDIPSDYQYCEG